MKEVFADMNALRYRLAKLQTPRMKETYTDLDIDEVNIPKNVSQPWHHLAPEKEKDHCVKYCQLPQRIWITASGREILSDTGNHIPYYQKPGRHVYQRRARCANLDMTQCVTTPTCGWKAQQKPNGKWVGRCYPGTTEGPLDPLKAPNYEENEQWIYSQPNPFVSM